MAATTAAAAASAGATINVGPTDEQFNEEDDVMSPAKEKATKKKYAPGRKKASRNKLPFEEVQIYFDELLEDAAAAEYRKKKTGGGGQQIAHVSIFSVILGFKSPLPDSWQQWTGLSSP